MGERISKVELAEELKDFFQGKYSKSAIIELIEALFEKISDKMVEGHEVHVPGFGKFEVRQRNARTARNPATGQTVQVPPKKAVAFKPASKLKEFVNK